MPGNKARSHRQHVLTPLQITRLVDKKLQSRGNKDAVLDDFIAELICQQLEVARQGDATAARWLIDRFAPPERKPRVRLGQLPKPSEQPLAFLDELAEAITAGELSIDDGTKLSRLALPTIADKQLADAIEQLERLSLKVLEQEKARTPPAVGLS